MLVSASLVVAPGLSPPRRQVSPIPLIGGKDPVLSVAGWWVGVVHPVLHGSAGPFRPRLQGRDATLPPRLLKPLVSGEPAQTGIPT